MRTLLPRVLTLLCLCAGASAQESPAWEEKSLVLQFSAVPGEHLTLHDFALMTQEVTGQRFTWAPELEKALAATPMWTPGPLRVSHSDFLAFARDELLLRGFGCFGGEEGQWTIRPVPPELVRLAFPDHELPVLAGRGHGRVSLPPQGEPPASGVVVDEPEAAPGPLLVGGPGASAVLLDAKGGTIRSWNDPELRDGAWGRWDDVTPLADGGLLCLDSSREALLRLAPDGRVRWRRGLPVHHAALALADGSFLVLTRRLRLVPEIDPTRRVVDNLVTHVSAEGEVLTEHSLLELLRFGPGAIPLKLPAGELPPGYDLDLLHAASLCRVDEAQAVGDPFRPGRLLVALRNLDRVVLVDLDSRACVWSHDLLSEPHDARILPDGTVLVLDAAERSGTRVIALDRKGELDGMKYRASRHEVSGCAGQGRIEPQANGNLLVGLPDEAFEITRLGKLVWRHRNPPTGMQGRLGGSWSRPGAEWVARLEPAAEAAPR